MIGLMVPSAFAEYAKKSYHNEEFNFSIDIPHDWKTEKKFYDDMSAEYILLNGWGSDYSVYEREIIIEYAPQDMSNRPLDAIFQDRMIQLWKNHVECFTSSGCDFKVNYTKVVKLDEITRYDFEFKWNVEDYFGETDILTQRVSIIVHDSGIWYVFSNYVDRQSITWKIEHPQMFWDIVSSFRAYSPEQIEQIKIEKEQKIQEAKQKHDEEQAKLQKTYDMIFEIPKTPEANTVQGWQDDLTVTKVNLHEGSDSDLLEITVKEYNSGGYPVSPETEIKLYASEGRGIGEQYSRVYSVQFSGISQSGDILMQKNPNFSFGVDCLFDTSNSQVQPGLSYEQKMCFEFPKTKNHFILRTSDFTYEVKIPDKSDIEFILEYEHERNFKKWLESETRNPQIIATFDRDDASNSSPLAAFSQPTQTSTPTQESSSEGGGCLIATAAYGTEMAPQVQFLRELRDNTVLQTTSGTAFMNTFNQFYYSFSPQIADYERENPFFKEMVKVTLTPLLTSLTLLNYVEIDSEEEMLGYGIGIILLDIGMYFVAPAILIISVKKVIFEKSPK